MSHAVFSTFAAQVQATVEAFTHGQQVEQSRPVELSLDQLAQVGGGAAIDSPKHGW